MKKTYIQPTVIVFELKSKRPLLTGSDPKFSISIPDSDPINYAGEDDGEYDPE